MFAYIIFLYTVVWDFAARDEARSVHKNKTRKTLWPLHSWLVRQVMQMVTNCQQLLLVDQELSVWPPFQRNRTSFDVQGCPGQLQCGRSLWSCMSGGWVTLIHYYPLAFALCGCQHKSLLAQLRKNTSSLQQTLGMSRHKQRPTPKSRKEKTRNSDVLTTPSTLFCPLGLQIKTDTMVEQQHLVGISISSSYVDWLADMRYVENRYWINACSTCPGGSKITGCKTYCIFWNCYMMQLGLCSYFHRGVFLVFLGSRTGTLLAWRRCTNLGACRQCFRQSWVRFLQSCSTRHDMHIIWHAKWYIAGDWIDCIIDFHNDKELISSYEDSCRCHACRQFCATRTSNFNVRPGDSFWVRWVLDTAWNFTFA